MAQSFTVGVGQSASQKKATHVPTQDAGSYHVADIGLAVANIAAMAKGLVYLEVTTRADLRDSVDKARTDADIKCLPKIPR